jgi:hypothetical protein
MSEPIDSVLSVPVTSPPPKTIELGYGLVQEGIDFKLEPLDDMISFTLARRSGSDAVIDVNCREPMSVWLGWRERHSARVQTQPTQILSQHQIVLSGLFPGTEYIFELRARLLMVEESYRVRAPSKLFLMAISPELPMS